MQFGKVEDAQFIDETDFTLPPDPLITDQVLKSAKKTNKTEVYVGCAKWGRPDWIGKIYPKGVKEKDYLSHYVHYFNSIELNAFFYRVFDKSTVEKWADMATDGFKFCPKFTNSITHIRRLKMADAITREYLDSVHMFGKKLGPCFLQLPPNFTLKSAEDLKQFLAALDPAFEVNVEFRHPDWFKGSAVAEEVFEFLRDRGYGTVITDATGRRDCVHQKLTNATAFIRFVGNNLHPTDFSRLDTWVECIQRWVDKGLQKLFFFIHNHEELNSPELCKYTIETMNRKIGFDLKVPVFLFEQPVNHGKL